MTRGPFGVSLLEEHLASRLAALIEGFFRQLVHSVVVRGSVAAASALLWTAYFVLAGRGGRR